MRKTTTCTNCNKEMDYSLDVCPNCRSININQPVQFKKMTMLNTIKQLLLFFIGWKGIDLISTAVQMILLTAFNVPMVNSEINAFIRNPEVGMAVNAGVYLVLFDILLVVVGFDIPRLFKTFKNVNSYIAACVCVVAMFVFNVIWVNFVRTIYPVTSNANESSLTRIESYYPVLSILIFGIIGPICEELTYRVGLFSMLSKVSKKLAYPLVCVVFALIHFNYKNVDIVNELLNLPTYIFAGLAFTFVYDKFGLSASLTAHSINNILSIILCANMSTNLLH